MVRSHQLSNFRDASVLETKIKVSNKKSKEGNLRVLEVHYDRNEKIKAVLQSRDNDSPALTSLPRYPYIVHSMHPFFHEIPSTLVVWTAGVDRGGTLERIKKLLKFRKHEFFINEKLSNPPFAYTMPSARARAHVLNVSAENSEVVKFLMVVSRGLSCLIM